jgi:hypothetical protein
MNDPKTPRFETEWIEIAPAVFERKGFSTDEVEKLNRRPNDLIRSAIVAAMQSGDDEHS